MDSDDDIFFTDRGDNFPDSSFEGESGHYVGKSTKTYVQIYSRANSPTAPKYSTQNKVISDIRNFLKQEFKLAFSKVTTEFKDEIINPSENYVCSRQVVGPHHHNECWNFQHQIQT